MNKKNIAILFSFIYFLVALVTLKNYNISWDEPTHFKRGQAYLHYFITGKLTFDDLPKYNLNRARTDLNYHERSMYQENGYDAQYHLEKDGDHPPLNDILASFTNYIFYQKLGIMGDVESYHLFEILVASALIGYVFLFGYEAFGFWSGIFSALFLATYPLFLGESHFNIKDPVETVFFSISIYYIWKSIQTFKVKYLLFASIFVGLALGTKLNIVFLPLTIFPWLIVLSIYNKDAKKFIFSKHFLLYFTLIPIIAFTIFVFTWPWLRQDILTNTLDVLGYYKDIGTEGSKISLSILREWNTYAIKWVFYSTQPIVLLFFVFTAFFWKKLKDSSLTIILLLFWLAVPIGRVVIPTSSIYGGVRQIMEYIPALAIIAGIGAGKIFEKITNKLVKLTFFTLILIITLIPIIKLHPNENVYLNVFAGGVKGAMLSGFPSAGFSFGNAYLQGLHWINTNVEDGAKLALVQGTVLNIPAYKIRQDINYSNAHWSGINRNGEYLIDLTYNYELKFFPYVWEYVEQMLEPVYEVKVNGVSILTVWKNDLDHTKPEYRKLEKKLEKDFLSEIKDNKIEISLSKKVVVTRVIINFTSNNNCKKPLASYIETSIDHENWVREKDSIPEEQISGVIPVDEHRLIYFFAGRQAKYIRFVAESKNLCILNKPIVSVYALE